MKGLFIIFIFLSGNTFCQKSRFLASEKRCDSTVLTKFQFDTVSNNGNIYKYYLIGNKKNWSSYSDENNKPIYTAELISPDFSVGMDTNDIKNILKIIYDRTGNNRIMVFRNYCAYEFFHTALKLSDEIEERKESFLARNYFGEFEFK